MTGHIAAQIARDAATDTQSELYFTCSNQMCWDAVIECQVRAGVKRPRRVTTQDHDHVISLSDVAVASAREMQRVPQGASIGFFRDGTLMHFMIAVGAGLAAGNKNQCIGIGNPVGSEILNLANDLHWERGGFTDRGKLFLVRYRPI
jgi:hypothetical protein